MKIFGSRIFVAFYFGVFSILFMGLSFCLGQEEIEKQDFKKKALLGQSQLLGSMQKVTATGTISHYSLTDGKPMRLVYHADGERRCAEIYDDDWQDSEDGVYGRIHVFTPSYHFKLTQKSPGSVYAIVTVIDNITETVKPRLRILKDMAVDNFLFAPTMIAGGNASEILEENGWQILKVSSVAEQSAGDLLYEVHIKPENLEDNVKLKRFVFTVSPNRNYGISSYETIYSATNPQTQTQSGKVEYLSEVTDGFSLFQVDRSMIQTTNGIAKTFNESVVFDSIKKGCRDEVFLLGHYFNTQDPFVRPRKLWPIYALIGSAVVAALGFYFLWFRRKTN